MDTLIYVHHYGHYWLPDSTSKVAIKTKQKNFMELFYDLTYSLPIALHNKQICGEYKEYSFDHCVNEVSGLRNSQLCNFAQPNFPTKFRFWIETF